MLLVANEVIQKSRIIFTCNTATLMKGPTRENIDLRGKIGRNMLRKNKAKLDLQIGISRASGSEMA